MKLIDILVRELPKLGGWPPAMDELYQLKSGVVIGGSATSIYSGHVFEVAKDVNNSSVNREQYESELAASQKLSWDGVGLPPVGCECEWLNFEGSYTPVKVVYSTMYAMVIHINDDGNFTGIEIPLDPIANAHRCSFRLLRSEADKKRDAVIEFITGAIDSHGVDPLNSAKFIYDAIAAGKIPGVKLED